MFISLGKLFIVFAVLLQQLVSEHELDPFAAHELMGNTVHELELEVQQRRELENLQRDLVL